MAFCLLLIPRHAASHYTMLPPLLPLLTVSVAVVVAVAVTVTVTVTVTSISFAATLS